MPVFLGGYKIAGKPAIAGEPTGLNSRAKKRSRKGKSLPRPRRTTSDLELGEIFQIFK